MTFDKVLCDYGRRVPSYGECIDGSAPSAHARHPFRPGGFIDLDGISWASGGSRLHNRLLTKTYSVARVGAAPQELAILPGISARVMAGSDVSTDGKETRGLGKESVATGAWSRDGASVYRLSTTEPEELFYVEIGTGRKRVLSTFPRAFYAREPHGGLTRMVLSPDGQSKIMTVRQMDGDIWILKGFNPPGSFRERIRPTTR